MTRMKRYDNISLLRILACFGVLVCHLCNRSLLDISGGIRKFTDFGGMGAFLFFIISGYLAFAVEDKPGGGYLIRRLFKILPVYYVIIIYNFILHEIFLKDVPIDLTGLYWWRYILLINTTVPTDKSFWFNLSATWTIPVFLLFYIMVPLLKRIIKNYYAALALIVILFGLSHYIEISTEWFKPITYLWYFAVGIIIWFAIVENKRDFTIILFTGVCLILYILRGYTITYSYVFIFAIILISSMNLKIKNIKFKFILNYLDRLSYVIYLVHYNILELVRNINLNKAIFNNAEMVLLILLLTFMISYFMSISVERSCSKISHYIVAKMKL